MLTLTTWLPLALVAFALRAAALPSFSLLSGRGGKIAPKVLIINMFTPEAQVWYGRPELNLLAHNVSVPGLSPLFPDVHCTANGEVCQVVTGEAEINAAVTMTALLASDNFDFRLSYFLIGGIAGVNPERGTLAGVSFARYAVQVGLQFEIDAREIPSNFTTGYWAQQSNAPGQYPGVLYGTEVFEVNDALRKKAVALARTAYLNDTSAAQQTRQRYQNALGFSAASAGPSVVECDVATSDTFWSGTLLAESFDNFTRLLTNGSAQYCSSAQEDNATLEALMRAAQTKRVDFSRIIVMRTFSDFDRPPPGETALQNLRFIGEAGFAPATENVFRAGVKVVQGILAGWKKEYKAGIKAHNYIGDIFGTLGGTPDFGPGPAAAKKPIARRSLARRRYH